VAEHRRTPDLIDDHVRDTERVRKLEVMPQSDTIVPKYWRPNTDELDAIVGHLLIIGVWHNPMHGFPLFPFVGPAAQEMAFYLWEQGFPSEEVGQWWTRFMQRVGALPPTASVDVWDMGQAEPGPGGSPPVGWQWAKDVATSPGSFPASAVWWRRLLWTGLPTINGATWHHVNEGEGVPAASFPDNGDGLWVANWPRGSYGAEPVDSRKWMVVKGSLRGSFEDGVDPVVRRDNTYGFTTATDCGGPAPNYNGATFPGRPQLYPTGPQPCPAGNAIGAVFYGGGIERAALFLSELDIWLTAPPVPLPPGTNIAGDHKFCAWQNDPSYDWLAETVALELPNHPEIESWYAHALPPALAAQQTGTRSNHLALRLAPGWFGRLEVQLRDQIAVLRGQVTCFCGRLRTHLESIAAWPVDYGASWPAERGYVLPDGALGSGYSPTFSARLDDGTPVPCLLANQSNGLRRIVGDGGWADAYESDHGISAGVIREVTLTFDGVSIPVEWPYA